MSAALGAAPSRGVAGAALGSAVAAGFFVGAAAEGGFAAGPAGRRRPAALKSANAGMAQSAVRDSADQTASGRLGAGTGMSVRRDAGSVELPQKEGRTPNLPP